MLSFSNTEDIFAVSPCTHEISTAVLSCNLSVMRVIPGTRGRLRDTHSVFLEADHITIILLRVYRVQPIDLA